MEKLKSHVGWWWRVAVWISYYSTHGPLRGLANALLLFGLLTQKNVNVFAPTVKKFEPEKLILSYGVKDTVTVS